MVWEYAKYGLTRTAMETLTSTLKETVKSLWFIEKIDIVSLNLGNRPMIVGFFSFRISIVIDNLTIYFSTDPD